MSSSNFEELRYRAVGFIDRRFLYNDFHIVGCSDSPLMLRQESCKIGREARKRDVEDNIGGNKAGRGGRVQVMRRDPSGESIGDVSEFLTAHSVGVGVRRE